MKSLSDLLGMKAPDFALPGTDGKAYTLASFADAKILVVIFMCNHCPYVKAVITRLNRLAEAYLPKNVRFVGISSNDASNYPDDSFDQMKQLRLAFPYLYDESQTVAKAYHAVCTPDIYLFNEQRALIYHGRIDDNWQDEPAVTKQELREAIEAALAGNSIPATDQNPSMGCSIKWKD